MSIWLDTRRKSTLGIGWCDRCKFKMSLDDLHPDRNNPGLRVCDRCNDEFDPYRLPARQPDDLTLPFYRTQEPLIIPDDPVDIENTFDALATEDEAPILAENGLEALEVEVTPPVGPILVTEEGEPILTEVNQYIDTQEATGPNLTAALGGGGYSIGYTYNEAQGSIDDPAFYPGYLIRVAKDIYEGAYAYDGFQLYISFDPASAPAPGANVITSVIMNGVTLNVADADVNTDGGLDRIYAWTTQMGLVDGQTYPIYLIF